MHKVERNKPPEGLEEKSIEFNKELNKETNITKVWEQFTGTKLKKQTLNQLKEMFKGCCAYCEGEYDDTSYGEIEHFKPKSSYPELMFEYNNMNLACRICNTNKKEKFDDKLINPTVENPEEHLRYQTYLLKPLDERGKLTIDTFDINNKERLNKRQKIYDNINNRMLLAKKWLNSLETNNTNSRNMLKDFIELTIKETEPMFENGFVFCTMNKHNFQNDIEDLKKILKKL